MIDWGFIDDTEETRLEYEETVVDRARKEFESWPKWKQEALSSALGYSVTPKDTEQSKNGEIK